MSISTTNHGDVQKEESPHGRRRGRCDGIRSAEARLDVLAGPPSNFESMERFGIGYIHEEREGKNAIRTNAAHRKAKMRQERKIVMWRRGIRMRSNDREKPAAGGSHAFFNVLCYSRYYNFSNIYSKCSND